MRGIFKPDRSRFKQAQQPQIEKKTIIGYILTSWEQKYIIPLKFIWRPKMTVKLPVRVIVQLIPLKCMASLSCCYEGSTRRCKWRTVLQNNFLQARRCHTQEINIENRNRRKMNDRGFTSCHSNVWLFKHRNMRTGAERTRTHNSFKNWSRILWTKMKTLLLQTHQFQSWNFYRVIEVVEQMYWCSRP